MANEKIYGKFTQAGHVTEVKPSADEEARMMRQMSFLPEGLKNESTVLVDNDEAAGIVLDVRMWIEVRKAGEVFKHPKFGNLWVLTDEKGDPWFVGKSDRKVLNYKDKNETLLSELWQGKDFRPKILINESGLYSLILGSKLPAAIEFKHWVTSEVLPQIRRTGGYIPTHDGEGKPLSDLEIMSLAFQIHERTIAERDRTHSYHDSLGSVHSHSYLVWTEKGRMFLDGILRRDLSPKEALRQVEQTGAPHVTKHVQLEINF